MFKLFGFEIRKLSEQENTNNKSFAPPQYDDGAITIQGNMFSAVAIDFGAETQKENELILQYRDMSLQPEIELAVEDITNEAIVKDEMGKSVDIILDEVKRINLSDSLKTKIKDEFSNVLRLLNFSDNGQDIFRRWYIDGRLHFHVVIDQQRPEEGIKELRYVDALKIKKVREIVRERDSKTNVNLVKKVNEYYTYNELAPNGVVTDVRVAPDSIIYIHSGILNPKHTMVLSYLQKAIKPLNQLRTMEDAAAIYRIARAPERRVFKIDVSDMNKQKAEQYMMDLITKHKNKLVYNQETGKVQDDRKAMSILEDYWLPVREGGQGTSIDTLPGGQNLDAVNDLKLFQEKFYRSLGIPPSRMEPQTGFTLGRSNEISRDELRFQKMIDKMRNRFVKLFDEALRIQLNLKGICNDKDWHDLREEIYYDFMKDNNFSELKEAELLNNRLAILTATDPFVGRYFSGEWVRKNILQQTEEEVTEIDKQIAAEGDKYTPPQPMGFGGGNDGSPAYDQQSANPNDQNQQQQNDSIQSNQQSTSNNVTTQNTSTDK